MAQPPVIDQMHQMLGRTRRRLGLRRLCLALLDALALGSWVVPITLALVVAVSLLARPIGMLTPGKLALIAAAAILSAVVCLILKSVRPLMHRPSWLDAAEVLDCGSNRHNLIATAYDIALQDRRSIFARMAMECGLTQLRESKDRPVHLSEPIPSLGRIGAGLLVTVLLAAAVYMIPCVSGDAATATGPASPNRSTAKETSRLSPQTSQRRLEPLNQTRPAFQETKASRQAQEATRSVLKNTLAAAGTSQDQAAPTRQPFSSESPSASAAPPQETPSSESRSASLRPVPRPATTRPAEEESSPTPIHTRQRAGSSGAPESESRLKASLLSGETDQDSEMENEEDRRQEKQQQRALAGTGGQPSLSDRLAAPSRDLGLSGKKSDQPPEGRGGPSDLKKSRATATILSGMPVPVHVKGMKQQGKSKSQARAMPLGAGDTAARPVVEPARPGREGAVLRYIAPEALKAVLDRYYQSLRESESTSEPE